MVRCEWDERPKGSKAKASNDALICNLRADYYVILHSKGRTLVTN